MDNLVHMFTVGEKVKSIPQNDVYLSLIADELHSYGIAHAVSDERLPVELAINYLKFEDRYWKELQTCLRTFNNTTKEKFLNTGKEEYADTSVYENILNEECDKDILIAISKAETYIRENIFKENDAKQEKRELIFHASRERNPNVHPNIIKLLQKRSLLTNKDISTVNVADLKKTVINNLVIRIRDIGKKALMKEALIFAKKRALLDKDGKYKFRKLVHSISDIYDDLKDSLPKDRKELDKTKFINHAANNYEIIDNSTYLLNHTKYKSAIREHFSARIKEFYEN